MILEIDVSSNPERHLLSQVVLAALNDSCRRPRQYKHRLVMRRSAFTAMRFLFDESVAGLNEYALWLDFDPGQARSRLLRMMENDGPHKIWEWDPMDRRAFRINYQLWQDMKKFDQYGLDLDDQDYDNE